MHDSSARLQKPEHFGIRLRGYKTASGRIIQGAGVQQSLNSVVSPTIVWMLSCHSKKKLARRSWMVGYRKANECLPLLKRDPIEGVHEVGRAGPFV